MFLHMLGMTLLTYLEDHVEKLLYGFAILLLAIFANMALQGSTAFINTDYYICLPKYLEVFALHK